MDGMGRVDYWRGRLWMVVVLGLALGILPAGGAAAQMLDEGYEESFPDAEVPTLGENWQVSISAGTFIHGGVRANFQRDDESGMMLNLAIGRPIRARTVWEVGASFYNVRPSDFAISVIQLKSVWRWYPGLGRPQKDQFFLQGGGTVLGAEARRGDARFGAGISVDLGVDWLLSQARSYFIQAGFSLLTMFGDDPPPPGPGPLLSAGTATVIVEPAPIGLMAQAVVGVRLGL